MLKDEKLIINIIKFGPIIFVIIFAFFITETFIYEKNLSFKKEIQLVEKTYFDDNKKRIKNEVERVYEEIKEEKAQAEEALKEMIKDRVYEAHKIATNIYTEESKFDNGLKHSEEHIFKTIKNALGSIIYNKGRGYFFIDSAQGVGLLQPLNKELENKNKLEFKDAKGYQFVKTIVQTIKDKTERFDTYYWYKGSNRDKSYKKTSFYKYFEPFNFAIGTGEYIEDFENEIKQRLLKRIRKMRFNKSGYIFIFDEKGKTLSSFKDEIIGTNRLNVQDINGRFYVKDIIAFAKKEQKGFIPYFMKFKPGEEEKNRTKISYVKFFKDWNWVIGTGFYLDNLNQQIAERKFLLTNSMNESIKQIIIISLILTLFFVLLSFYISRMITHRLVEYKKNLEAQIIENIEQKETLLEAQKVAKIGSWKLIPSTNIAEWSEEVLHIFGIEEKSITLSPEYMRNIILEEDLIEFELFLEECMIENKQNRTMFRIYKPDNEIRWLECRGRLDKEKNIIIGTIQDITESKNLEIEKKDKEQLLYQQSKLAAMGEMIGNIAHQWRQPLSVISVTATGAKLQKEMDCLNDENLDKTFDAINESAQYLSQTIEDFRSFFNPSNLKVNKFNISNTISKTLNIMNIQLSNKNIKIIKEIKDVEISSIENELIQVLINILENSKDTLMEKEHPTKLLFISTEGKGTNLIIKIKDNGQGIQEDIMEKIFEPYFTTKHKSQGTGLGLYMSSEIIKKHLKGDITVKNTTYIYEGEKYKGAKFTITIPILSEES